MNPVWNNLTTVQQQQFLQQSGLSSLPEPSSLTPAQLNLLTGIAGEETVKTIKGAGAGSAPYSVSSPPLPAPGEFTGDFSDIMAKVAEMQAKLGELMAKVASEGVKGQKDDMKRLNEEEAKRIQESIKKLGESAKSSFWGKLFGWIGAVVGVIGAAIATVATGGAAAPALAIAILGLTMMILQETGAMDKIVEALVKNPEILMAVLTVALGPIGLAAGATLVGLIRSGTIDEDQAKMAIQLTIAAAMLVGSVVSMVASGGASAVGTFAQFAKIAGIVAQGVGAAASIGSGAAGVAHAVQARDAADLQADAKEITAWLARLQQTFEEEAERLQKVLDQLNSGLADVSGILSDIAKSNRAVIGNMGA